LRLGLARVDGVDGLGQAATRLTCRGVAVGCDDDQAVAADGERPRPPAALAEGVRHERRDSVLVRIVVAQARGRAREVVAVPATPGCADDGGGDQDDPRALRNRPRHGRIVGG